LGVFREISERGREGEKNREEIPHKRAEISTLEPDIIRH